MFCTGTGEVLPPPATGWDEREKAYRKGEERLGSGLFITSLHKRGGMGNRLDSKTWGAHTRT